MKQAQSCGTVEGGDDGGALPQLKQRAMQPHLLVHVANDHLCHLRRHLLQRSRSSVWTHSQKEGQGDH